MDANGLTAKVADGVCRLGQPHSDGPGWSTQMTDAFGTTSNDFSHLVFNQVMRPVRSTFKIRRAIPPWRRNVSRNFFELITGAPQTSDADSALALAQSKAAAP
jgi:hypothetical protein